MRQSVKKFETKKLHYGRFLYKVSIRSELAHIFRTELQRKGNLAYASSELFHYEQSYKAGRSLQKKSWRQRHSEFITHEDFLCCQKIYRWLKNSKDYLVRCEMNTLNIYSNNENFIKKFTNLETCIDYSEPDPNMIEFLTNNANVIITDTPPVFPLKITFGQQPGKKELGKWLIANKDKARCGPVLLDNCLKEARWIKGQYIFIRDEKVLIMLQLICGDNISRVDKLVYKEDIDK